jgi:TonB family protein
MIAYAMLYAVAVGVPTLLATVVVAAVLRRAGRAERWVWLGGLGLAFVLPVIGLLRIGGAGDAAGPVPMPEVTGVIGLPDVLLVPQAPQGPGLGQIVLIAWLLVSCLLAVRWLVAAVRLARAERSWQATTLDGVPVLMTDKLGPAVSGVVRPRVLVPPWLLSMPAQRRALVLLHEQEHIRAGDPRLVVLARLAPVLAPWNPVAWFLSSRLIRAIELDCDRRVLRQRPDVRAYGTTLIEVSSRDHGRLVAVAAFAETEAPLRNRILTMTTPARTVSVVALLTSMVLGVVLMIAAFEIPIPTIRAEFEIGPGAEIVTLDPEPSGAGAVTPPEPEPAEEPEPTDEPAPAASQQARGGPAIYVDGVRVYESDEEAGDPPGPTVVRGREPVFTPFTVAPALINLQQVQQALADGYPTVLRDSGIGGRVTVWFYIDEDGRVDYTRINESSGYAALDQAALDVAEVYRFSPARNREQRVPVWVSLPITFQVR